MSAPSLSRSEQKKTPTRDPKWAIGDALLEVDEDRRDEVAILAGIKKSNARSYWRTSQAWPPETRTIKSCWSAYRELRDPHLQGQLRPDMTLRQANFIKTGRKMDRQAPQAMDDDALIDELVELMLSPRSKGLVPKIIERLNLSKEGRKISMAKRSAKAIRMLQDEIRQVMTEVRRRRDQNSPDLRFMEVKRKFLDTRVIVEEIGLLHADPDDRRATTDDAWREMAKRLDEHGDVAQRIARKILHEIDVVDVEWVDETQWEVQSLLPSVAYDGEIVEAEVVE